MNQPLSYQTAFTGVTPTFVQADVPCRKCGSRLDGLYMGTRCPQCGTWAAQTVFGDLLQFADPAWVGRLRSGLLIALWSILGGVVLTALVTVAIAVPSMIAAARSGATQPAQTVTAVAPQVVAIDWTSFITWLAVAYGIFRATTSEPATPSEPQTSLEPGPSSEPVTALGRTSERWRRMTRLCVFLTLLNLAVQCVLTSASSQFNLWLLTPQLSVNKIAYQSVGQFLYVLFLIALTKYSVGLASRLHYARLRRQILIGGWGTGITTLLLNVISWAQLGAGVDVENPLKDNSGLGIALFATSGVTGVAGLIFMIISLVEAIKLAKGLRQARDLSAMVHTPPGVTFCLPLHLANYRAEMAVQAPAWGSPGAAMIAPTPQLGSEVHST